MDEHKFKAGDRVVAKSSFENLDEGEIYTIAGYARATQFGEWVYLSELRSNISYDGSFLERNFEPVAVADSNGNRFKVGDRVRCIDDSGTTRVARGEVYTVEGIKGKFITVRGDNMYYYRFEPVDAPLTIHSGKFYRTRDGRKVGPMVEWRHSDSSYQWESGGYLWKDDGENYDKDSEHTIIAEWTDEPVAAGGSDSNDTIDDWYFGKTAGYTVPLCAMEDDAPKFKVGDRVEYDDGRTNGVGDIIEVLNESEFDYMVRVESKDARYAYYPDGIGRKFAAANLRLVAPATSGKDTINRIPWMRQADNNVATIADIVRRLEALEAKQPAEPEHCIGDKVTLSATVTGMNKRRVNVVIDGVPQPGGSLAVPPAALTAA